MDRELLKIILLEQNKLPVETIIPRTIQQQIQKYENNSFVIIISGIRRCGKSTLLRTLKTEHSYYVNFDDERLLDFEVKDFHLLQEVLIELFGERNIFLFDEIQNVLGWERFVRRLHDENKKVYVTGSNATMLSKELGTHLTGRSISLILYPFSFAEFLVQKGQSPAKKQMTTSERATFKRLFLDYLQVGGFPEYIHTLQDDYLRNLYQNILYRDIITRYRLSLEKPLKETVYYAASNISKELSFNTLKKITGLSSATTIREYFEYMENSFLVFLIPRFDFSLKKQIYYNKKPYLIDTALTRIIGFHPTEDAGRMLENAVFLELKRRGKEIYFHKNNGECDFILRSGRTITHAIQVTTNLQKNKSRELEGLIDALKCYNLNEGLIITFDEEEEFVQDQKKIKVKPVWKWLLEEQP